MILLEVHYMLKEGAAAEFLEDIYANRIDIFSREEDGNSMYDYFSSVENPDELVLIEKWADDEALAAHHASEHFALLAPIKDRHVNEVIVKKYYVEGE